MSRLVRTRLSKIKPLLRSFFQAFLESSFDGFSQRLLLLVCSWLLWRTMFPRCQRWMERLPKEMESHSVIVGENKYSKMQYSNLAKSTPTASNSSVSQSLGQPDASVLILSQVLTYSEKRPRALSSKCHTSWTH